MNLALKYRPRNFSDLVGHDVLVRVLKNSFILDKIPQSILLTGSSGIGKTTVARIISLCLNCLIGPTAEPCCICENCDFINNSRHPDVVEIDAASNTGVDDMRALLANSYYLPIMSKFKVYIIDEAHMLSNSAFNSMLKTLEEPSPHVKFIFATTELRKIPPTIISRCLQFDLKKISSTEIAERLKVVMKSENISCEQKCIQFIAHAAEGSMRSALSLLDQVILYEKSNQISIKAAQDVIGFVDQQLLVDLLSHILQGNALASLETLATFNKSSDPIMILEDMMKIIGELSHYMITTTTQDFYDEDCLSKLAQFGKSPVFLSRLWQACLKGLQEARSAFCSITALDMLVIRLCYLSDLPSPSQIIKKIQSQQQVLPASTEYNKNVQNVLDAFPEAKVSWNNKSRDS